MDRASGGVGAGTVIPRRYAMISVFGTLTRRFRLPRALLGSSDSARRPVGSTRLALHRDTRECPVSLRTPQPPAHRPTP